MDIKSILGGISLAKELAGYLGLYETLSIKIDKLLRTELHAGIKALEQSINSEKEKKELLREARQAFNKASALEKNERLILAHIGLAICHKNLGDEKNFVVTLSNVQHINFEGVNAELAKGALSNAPFLVFPFFGLALGMAKTKSDLDIRIQGFNKLKSDIQVFLDDYLSQ